MIISRRSYLLSGSSPRLMRAAAAAASPEAARHAARKQAGEQHAELMARMAVKPEAPPHPVTILPPTLYDQAKEQGYEMAHYAPTPMLPTR